MGGVTLKKASTVALAACLLVTPVFGQAQFSGKGGNTTAASLGYAGNWAVKAIGLDVAFSPVNILDFGISGTGYTGDNDAIAIAPFFGFWFLNENNGNVPLSLCASLSMGYLFRRQGFSDRESISTMSISAHKNINLSRSSILQPYLGAGIADAGGYESEGAFLAGLVFFIRTANRSGLALSNGYAISGGTLTISLSIGVVGGSRLAGSHGPDWDVW